MAKTRPFQTYVALLRSVNVAGRSPLSTANLVRTLEGLGLRNVRTYIQTGNAAFLAPNAKGLREKIQSSLVQALGFSPEVIVFTLDELEHAIAANPFPQADAQPKTLHLMFLAEKPSFYDPAAFERLRHETEQFALHERVFYFHAPNGIGRSRLFARAEKLLSVAGTARNWRTARHLLELSRDVARDAGSGRRAAKRTDL